MWAAAWLYSNTSTGPMDSHVSPAFWTHGFLPVMLAFAPGLFFGW